MSALPANKTASDGRLLCGGFPKDQAGITYFLTEHDNSFNNKDKGEGE